MIKSRICDILGIQYPVFQGGMAWVADASLAAAVSNAGGLGLISSINAGTEAVREEIRKCRELTDKPFGVNIMLQAPNAAEIAHMVVEEGVKILTTGAGSPSQYMPMWKEAGIKVLAWVEVQSSINAPPYNICKNYTNSGKILQPPQTLNNS